LFAFGTVYFFSAVQGTVWFAAHVVGVGLAALFVLFSLGAERPILAGTMLGFMLLTRPTTSLVGVFFALELVRVAYERGGASDERQPRPLPTDGPFDERIAQVWRELDRAFLFRTGLVFALPIIGCLAYASWLNFARFHDAAPWAFGHEYLQ